MKKTPHRRAARAQRDEMRGEYRFDYRKERPNRFTGRFQADAVAVVLDPDVALVFRSPLRARISALRARNRGQAKAGQSAHAAGESQAEAA